MAALAGGCTASGQAASHDYGYASIVARATGGSAITGGAAVFTVAAASSAIAGGSAGSTYA